MTPREFLVTVVSPNMAAIEKDFGDMRAALNAVQSVDALTARIFYAASNLIPAKNDSEYREQIARQHSDFRIMRDLAKAIKHGKLEQGKPVVSGADKIVVKSLGWDEGRYDEARWDSPLQVVVETNSGSLRAIEGIARNALLILTAEMVRLGL